MDADTLPYLVEQYPLLITKLYIPRPDTKLLARPHLLEMLNRAVKRPLVLITAPAGWGKTTLVSDWARQSGRPVAWISLDEGDNDLVRFWPHLIASLQQIHQGMGETALSWFYMPIAPPLEARLTMLINDLALANETFVLVLDDVHCIRSSVIHDSLAFFVEHLPPNMHLILTSRSDIPLPRARWRAGGRMVEIESRDLQFTLEEGTEFLHKVMGLRLTPEQITALQDRTEGWIAGLQLVALALQGTALHPGGSDVDGFIAGLGATSRYIFDYLSEEVLAGQEPEIQEFLLKTAVLERLSGELCEAVTGDQESQSILERLEQSKLFIVTLDEGRHWFRYHHLFRDFLLSQLVRRRPDAVADLHRRAAQWYATREMPHDAVPHAIEAQDYELAGRIMMQYVNPLWQREELMTLHGWLEVLPRELRERHPDLCLFQAWSVFILFGLEKKLDLLVRAEVLLNEGAPPLGNFSSAELRGILAAIRAGVSSLQQDLDAASEFARSALAQLPPDRNDWRYAALVGAGMALHYQNDTKAAVQAFEQAFEEAAALPHALNRFYGRMFARSWLARLYVVQGHLQQAKGIYQDALRQATGQAGKPIPIGTWAVTDLGELYYQWNELENAETCFHESLALSTEITPFTSPPYLPLARLAYARGDVRAAQAYLAQAAQLAETARLPHYSEQVELCRVWLALQEGGLDPLEHWIQDQGLDLAQPTPSRETAYLTAARILLAQQDYSAALALIEKLLGMAEDGGRGWVILELLILQALVLQGQDRLDSALKILQSAIALASQEGYVMLFVEEGDGMLQLLRLFVARYGSTDYLARLLGAFVKKSKTPELMNERELEILRLLATGMSNKEIAETLFITVGTVKWHTNHIYTKLGVKNRGQAVAKARELKLISNSTDS